MAITMKLVRADNGEDFSAITVGTVEPGVIALPTISVLNDGDETPTGLQLHAAEKDGGASGENANGAELVAEHWLEAKLAAGAWTPMGNIASGVGLVITPMIAGGRTSVELRANIPVGASSFGNIEASLELAAW